MRKGFLILISAILAVGTAILGVAYYLNIAPPVQQETVIGVTDSSIRIGSISPLTGPNGFFGAEYLRGAQVYFNAVNDRGGIYGRRLELISYDDQYDPPKTVYYTQRLLTENKVFALLNYFGTPTGKKIIPITDDANIPLVGIFSGADIFRNPIHPNIFNIRASYYQEADIVIKELVAKRNISTIGVLYQYDDFGFDGLKGIELALAKYGLKPTVIASYERNTSNVEGAFAIIKHARPDAVVMVATYGPAIKFIKLAHADNYTPLFHAMSFAGAEVLKHDLGTDSEGMLISNVVPFPSTDRSACPNGYVRLLEKYFSGYPPTFAGFEGYINAKILGEGLLRAGSELTRERFVSAMNSITRYPIGDAFTISFKATNHQGADRLFLTQIHNGEFVPVGDSPKTTACVPAF